MSTLKEKAEQILEEKNEKIIPDNIKKDVQVFDIVGTLDSGIDTSDATATANDLVKNKTAYVNGQKLTGTIADWSERVGSTGLVSYHYIIPIDGSCDIPRWGVVDGALQVRGQWQDGPAYFTNGSQIEVWSPYELVRNGIGLTAEKIKKDETILGITGTYEGSSSGGDVKLFDTINNMQQDENPQHNDLAVVYREELSNITSSSQFAGCAFPSEVVLSEAVSSSVYGRFASVDGNSYYDGSVMLSSTSFRFDGYGSSSEVTITYTSNDGITYTRTDGGDELVNFGVTIRWESWGDPWNDNFGEFMKLMDSSFDGLFKYNANYYNKDKNKMIPIDNFTFDLTTPSYTYTKIDRPTDYYLSLNDIAFIEEEFWKLHSPWSSGSYFSYNIYYNYSTSKLYVMVIIEKSGSSYRIYTGSQIAGIVKNGNTYYPFTSYYKSSKDNIQSTSGLYEIDIANQTLTKVKDLILADNTGIDILCYCDMEVDSMVRVICDENVGETTFNDKNFKLQYSPSDKTFKYSSYGVLENNIITTYFFSSTSGRTLTVPNEFKFEPQYFKISP